MAESNSDTTAMKTEEIEEPAATLNIEKVKTESKDTEKSSLNTESNIITESSETAETAEGKETEEVSNGKDIADLSVMEKAIICQIEYYFGDINLPRDKFLLEQVKLDEGWIPLDIMLNFKRLASLSSDTEVIVKALAKSSTKLMEISEDGKKIRRSTTKPLPIFNEDRRKELMKRTVYVKGFPSKGFTMDDALSFFSAYGPIESVQLRTLRDKVTSTVIFKGSVYIIFETLEGATKFYEIEEPIKYEETVLIKKWQADHLEQKRIDRKTGPKSERNAGKKAIEADDAKKENTSGSTSASNASIAKGCLLHFQGFSGETTREEIKRELQALGAEVAFVDFNKGDAEGWVRLEKENSAKELLEKMDNGKMEISGNELEVTLVEGEEEEAFIKKSLAEMLKRRSQNNTRKGRGGRGGRGRGRGRGGFRGRDKRRGSPNRGDGGGASKKSKLSD